MVDTNPKSEQSGQGKKGKTQDSNWRDNSDKGEAKNPGNVEGIVAKQRRKFEKQGNNSSSTGTQGAPSMFNGLKKIFTFSSKTGRKESTTNESRKGSSASAENDIKTKHGIVDKNEAGQGRGGDAAWSQVPLQKSKVTQDELDAIDRGTSPINPSANSIPLPDDATETGPLNPPQDEGAATGGWEPTGWQPPVPTDFLNLETHGRPFNDSTPSSQKQPASNSNPNTSKQEKRASNSDSPTQEKKPQASPRTTTLPAQTPSSGQKATTCLDPHIQENGEGFPQLPPDFSDPPLSPTLCPTRGNDQQSESGDSALDEYEVVPDPLRENWPRPLEDVQAQPLAKKRQQPGYPQPVSVVLTPQHHDPNVRGPTYAPNETYVSEELWEILDKKGDEHEAIFFSRYVSPSNPALPPLMPFSLNPDKWESSDHFAPVPLTSEKRWGKIVRELTSLTIACETEQLRKIGARVANAVKSYCREAEHYDFEILAGRDISKHVAATIPIIVDQALMLPSLLARQIPLLECGQSKTIFVSKKLCCSLLANAFFSTFPPQRSNMPDINFHRLFSSSSSQSRSNVKVEKIMCILNYFHQITTPSNQKQFGNNIISFERRHQTQIPDWETLKEELINVVVEPSKKIEEMEGMLQVDFANKVVGGGVLNDGAIMEEILFVISPELILSRLFTETLEDNEVLVITGAHQFSEYEGYSASFVYKNPYQFNNVETDNLGRLLTQMVAMDALHFKGDPKVQFQQDMIDRELQKSFVGFGQGSEVNRPVATGNWGCGAFNGDTELKFLIQWLAATVAGRPEFHYHTVGDKQQASAMMEAIHLLQSHRVDSGKLYKLIVNFYPDRFDYGSIFQFIGDYLDNRFRTSL